MFEWAALVCVCVYYNVGLLYLDWGIFQLRSPCNIHKGLATHRHPDSECVNITEQSLHQTSETSQQLKLA